MLTNNFLKVFPPNRSSRKRRLFFSECQRRNWKCFFCLFQTVSASSRTLAVVRNHHRTYIRIFELCWLIFFFLISEYFRRQCNRVKKKKGIYNKCLPEHCLRVFLTTLRDQTVSFQRTNVRKQSFKLRYKNNHGITITRNGTRYYVCGTVCEPPRC